MYGSCVIYSHVWFGIVFIYISMYGSCVIYFHVWFVIVFIYIPMYGSCVIHFHVWFVIVFIYISMYGSFIIHFHVCFVFAHPTNTTAHTKHSELAELHHSTDIPATHSPSHSHDLHCPHQPLGCACLRHH